MQAKRGIKLYRVFFNRRGAPKNEAWSVDTGEGTERRHFRSITIRVPTIGFYNGKDPDWQNPIAWFAVRGRMNIARSGIDAIFTDGGRRKHDRKERVEIRRGVRPRTRRVSA